MAGEVLIMSLSSTELKALLNAVSSSIMVEVTLTLDTSAYAAGDVLADTQEIADALPAAGEAVTLQSLVILDKSDQAQGLDILILRSDTSIGTENVAFSPSDAVSAEILAVVEIAAGEYYDMTNNQLVRKGNSDIGMGMVLEPTSGTSLYIAAVSRGTGTYAADGIVVKLGFSRG